MFFCGAGAGSLVAVLLIFLVLSRTTKKTRADTAETIRLMRERNEIDRSSAQSLRRIADAACMPAVESPFTKSIMSKPDKISAEMSAEEQAALEKLCGF